MARGKKTDDATRAAVMGALLTGQSVSEIAKQTGLPKMTVSDIKDSISEEEFVQVRTEKKTAIADQVAEVLQSGLAALMAITHAVSHPDYAKGQPANEVAVLYGVIADKQFRILEALAGADQGTSPGNS